MSNQAGPPSYSPQQEIPLPSPWIREWDANYQTFYYVNPTTTPPTTQWTHPSLQHGEAAPEQAAAIHVAQTAAADPNTHVALEKAYHDGAGRPYPQSMQGGQASQYMSTPPQQQQYQQQPQYQQQQQQPQYQQQQQQYAQQPATNQDGTADKGWGKIALGGAGGVAAAALLGKVFSERHHSSGLFGNLLGGGMGGGMGGGFGGGHNMGPPPFMGGGGGGFGGMMGNMMGGGGGGHHHGGHHGGGGGFGGFGGGGPGGGFGGGGFGGGGFGGGGGPGGGRW